MTDRGRRDAPPVRPGPTTVRSVPVQLQPRCAAGPRRPDPFLPILGLRQSRRRRRCEPPGRRRVVPPRRPGQPAPAVPAALRDRPWPAATASICSRAAAWSALPGQRGVPGALAALRGEPRAVRTGRRCARDAAAALRRRARGGQDAGRGREPGEARLARRAVRLAVPLSFASCPASLAGERRDGWCRAGSPAPGGDPCRSGWRRAPASWTRRPARSAPCGRACRS